PATRAAAAGTGADRVALHAEPYAAAVGTADEQAMVARYAAAPRSAQAAGLGVNAGHDLNRDNLPRALGAVSGIAEVSIGHALVADALEYGLTETVREYLRVLGERN